MKRGGFLVSMPKRRVSHNHSYGIHKRIFPTSQLVILRNKHHLLNQNTPGMMSDHEDLETQTLISWRSDHDLVEDQTMI